MNTMNTETETETQRAHVKASPRMNTSEHRPEHGESWHVKAIMSYADVVRLIGEEPEDLPCERWGRVSSCRRRACDPCEERAEWESGVLGLVQSVTDWGLYGSGYGVEGCPGRRYCDTPSVYRHARHPGVVVVTWSGGIDI